MLRGFRFKFSNSRGDMRARSRGNECPSFVNFDAVSEKRAQGKPGADCTRGPRATKSTGVGPQVQPETSRLSLRDGFTVSFALSPVTGLLPPSSLRSLLLTNLAPAPGRQDHTTSPSASYLAFVFASAASTASHRALVTLRNAPLIG